MIGWVRMLDLGGKYFFFYDSGGWEERTSTLSKNILVKFSGIFFKLWE